MAGSSYKGTDLKNVDQFLTEDGLDSQFFAKKKSASTSATATTSTWSPITTA